MRHPFPLAVALAGVLFLASCRPSSAAPPPDEWAVHWLEIPEDASWPFFSRGFEVSHQGAETDLQVVCVDLRDGEVLSETVVLDVPFVGTRIVDKGTYTTHEDMLPGEVTTLRFTIAIHDLSSELDAEENAYFVMHRERPEKPDHGSIFKEMTTVAAFGAPGDLGSGPSYSMTDQVLDVNQELELAEVSKWYRDSSEGSRMTSVFKLRWR